jgi:hypothetical protein
MKRALKIGTVLFALSLPVWANSPDWYKDKDKHRRQAVPEGGNAIAYTIVSSAAILGGLLLARKQRTTKTVSTKS